MSKAYEERKQWFLDRVGKRLFRESNGCSCGVCEHNEKNGVLVSSDMHALYMLDMEGMSNTPRESDHPFKYRDEL